MGGKGVQLQIKVLFLAAAAAATLPAADLAGAPPALTGSEIFSRCSSTIGGRRGC
jgi:hypothetical protein